MFEEKFTEFVTLHSRRAPLSDNEAAVVRHSCRAVAAGTESWSADRSVTTSLVFLLRGDSPEPHIGDGLEYRGIRYELGAVTPCRDVGGRLLAWRCVTM